MNKQPFYTTAIVNFTATREFSLTELQEFFSKKIKSRDIVRGSVEVEDIEAEPGDPADLMG